MLIKSEFKPERFSIIQGQIRNKEIVHNGGWYNALGEKLGWGDLDEKDVVTISQELKDNELFVVMPESDSYWKFVTFEGNKINCDPKEQNPGIEYLCDHCYLVILPGKFHWVTTFDPDPPRSISRERSTEIIMEHGNL
jgi:hypothetical protein